jgi:hypothetical protein
MLYTVHLRAGIAQSVQRLTTGWTTEGSEFESRYGKEFSLLHVVQTGSEAHLASFPTGTGDSFPWGKADGGIKLITHFQLALRLRKYDLYTHSPIRLHGVVLN